MEKRKSSVISRRKFLEAAALMGVTALAAACTTPQAEPTKAPAQAATTAIVKCSSQRDAILAELLGKETGEPAPAIDWEEVRRATCEDDK